MKILTPVTTQAITDLTTLIIHQGYQYEFIIGPFVYSWAIYTPKSFWYSPALIGVFNVDIHSRTFMVIYSNPKYQKKLRDSLAPALEKYLQKMDPNIELTVFMDPVVPTP